MIFAFCTSVANHKMHSAKFPVLVVSIALVICGASSQICDLLDKISESDINAECIKQLDIVCNNASLFWRFFDSSSKLVNPGLSYSNNIDFGNFHECLEIDYDKNDDRILGKYCGMSIAIPNILNIIASQKAKLADYMDKEIKTRINPFNKYNSIRADLPSDIDFNTDLLKLSVCIPDACSPNEVAEYFVYGYIFNNLTFYTGLECETKLSNTELDGGDIAFITVLSLIVLVMIESTIYDAFLQRRKQRPYHPLLIAFSVLTNGQKLLHVSSDSKEQIQCFNGMRFISMMWIIAYHNAIPYQTGLVGVTNWPDVLDWTASWTNRYILSALLAVDTFFFMAGFLLAYGYLKSSIENSLLDHLKGIPSMYFHRYIRLTPAVGAMYCVVITIYRLLGSGSVWSAVTWEIRDNCRKYWWQFFLYIQNYTNPDEMCINPMWYLSADMQMFILAPIILIPTAIFIKKHFFSTIFSLIALTIIWVILPIVIRYEEGKQGNTYGSHERFNEFLIGFIFGAVMRMKRDKPYIFSPLMNIFLWVVVFVVSLAFNIFWHDVEYQFEFVKYTVFIGLYRPLWCLCLVFMVYSCYNGHGGIVNLILSRPIFQILGRLAYSMYVLHVIVVMYAAGINTTNDFFSNYFLLYKWCGHFVVTLVASVFWVLTFEMPMITIEKTIRNGFKKKSKGENN